MPDEESDKVSQEASEKEIVSDVPQALVKDAELITVQGTVISKDGDVVFTQENDSSLSNNVFSDPEVKAYYLAVYEKSKYECRHLFDADLYWTTEEERKLVRKLDWHVCLWACVMFFSLQVDRGNLIQALAGTLLKDLKLTTNDYNLGNTVFLTSFLLAELPSQLISKKLGPDRWIPTQMVLWSIVAMSQAALTGRGSFLATRSLLGILEGGFIPDRVLWLSYFYTSRELPIRLSFFWTALSVTTIVTSLLAFAIFHLDGYNGLAGWRWLFLLEGLITLIFGISSFFLMPASAVQTKTWFRPKGWFTDRELGIAVNRVLRNDPSKGQIKSFFLYTDTFCVLVADFIASLGDMHNRQAITPRRLWNAIRDYDLWPIYILGLICFIPQTPATYYITLTLKNLGFNTFNINLLTIPYSACHIITLLGITWLSEKLNERALVGMLQSVWTLPCIIALFVWPDLNKNAWGTFALVNVLLSYPYCHAINVGWASKNSNNVGSRSVSTALYNMFVQVGNISSANIYQAADAPLYRKGNRNLVIINAIVIAWFIFSKLYYVTKNKIRDRKWNTLSPEERSDYILNTTDKASRRLNFRFAH